MIRQKASSWNTHPSWEFEIPQQTFRQPSASALDKAQHDPVASEVTPKITFKWRKDSKLSKDLACFLSGKTTNPDGSKKKNREPDITIAIFKGLREMTLYEPNLQRVDLEDMKGFEVVLLLSAVVIRDVFFGHVRETFNITDALQKVSSHASGKPTAEALGKRSPGRHNSPAGATVTIPTRDPRVPPTDPRSQWEIDAETARLKRQAAEEERQRKKREQAEQRQIKQMLEEEERTRRRRQAEVDRETERLKRIYGQPIDLSRPSLPAGPQRRSSAGEHSVTGSYPPRPHTSLSHPYPWGSSQAGHGSYLHVPGGSLQGGSFGPAANAARLKDKKGFFACRRHVDDGQRLQKKSSSLF